MSEWAKGYQDAVRDLRQLAGSRRILTAEWEALFDDLHRDAFVIDHEADNRRQRSKLAAEREAQPDLPL